MTDNVSQVSVRDAGEADVPALTAIKGEWSEAIHRDRLRDVREGGFRYFVLTAGEEVVGYSCLVFQRPGYWLDANDTEHLPQIVDLQVDEFAPRAGLWIRFYSCHRAHHRRSRIPPALPERRTGR